MFPSRVFLRLVRRNNKKSELAHSIHISSPYQFQLLSCTFSHRTTPYQRSSLQLEIGVLPPNSLSLPGVSAASISSGKTKNSSVDEESNLDAKVREIISSFSPNGGENNQGFLLEPCNDGGVALVGVPFSLLHTSNFPSTPSAMKQKKSANAKKGSTNSTSAVLAGLGDGAAGYPPAHSMFSPLSFLFSSETGKVIVPESVRVIALNQHIHAPLDVYDSCLHDLLHDCDRIASERNRKSPSFSSPLLSVFLDLSLHFPLLLSHTSMETKGQRSTRVPAATREEEDVVEEHDWVQKTPTSKSHSPSLALPSTVSSPTSSTKGKAPIQMHPNRSGKVGTSVRTTALPQRGRGRPAGVRNKKLSLKEKRMTQSRVPIRTEDSAAVASSSSSTSPVTPPPPSPEKKRRGRKPLSAASKTPTVAPTTTVSPLPAQVSGSHSGEGARKTKKKSSLGPLGALNDPALPVETNDASEKESSLVTPSVDDVMRVMQELSASSSSSRAKDSGATGSTRKTAAKVPLSSETEEKLPWFHGMHDKPSSADSTSGPKGKKSGALKKSSAPQQSAKKEKTTERVSFSPDTSSPVLASGKTPKEKKKKEASQEKVAATASPTPITAPNFSDSIAKMAVQDFLSRIKRPETTFTSTSSSQPTQLSSTVKPVPVTPPILKIPTTAPTTKSAEKKKKGKAETVKALHEMKSSTVGGEKVFHF